MRNVPILYCGSSFVRSLYDTLLGFQLRPILFPSDTPLAVLQAVEPLCMMISGSPDYINIPGAPTVDTDIYSAGIPIFGICYGMQRMAKDLGGEVKRLVKPERECVKLTFEEPSVLYRDFMPEGAPVWMSHTCVVSKIPEEFSITGSTEDTPIASMEDEERGLFAVQYHPEHRGKDPSSQAGSSIIWNFLNGFCGYSI